MERFWAKVDRGSGCWIWTGYTDRDGYGLFVLAPGRTVRAHRFAFELEHGQDRLPKGEPLDHLCHDPRTCTGGPGCPHRPCVRPSHLKLTTIRENGSRSIQKAKTHCKRGHEFTEANTYVKGNGTRMCRACHKDREKLPDALTRRAAAQRRYTARLRAGRES